MPTSAIGIWTERFRQSGFTLLEVMVTVVLIGIITTFAVLSVRGTSDSGRLADEARRLAALLELNQQEAIMRGEQRGVYFTENGYAFVSRLGNEWRPLSDSTLRKDYYLPPGFTIALWIEDRRVNLDDKPAAAPQILLLSSGESTDFRVIFGIADSKLKGYSVNGDVAGNLRYGPVP